MKVTPCECAEPGWCQRHQCQKSWPLFELCQRRLDVFEAWERGALGKPVSAELRTPHQASDCIHRGAEVDRVICPTCRGHVELKVFNCAVHVRCVMARPVDGMQVCTRCTDYQCPSLSCS